MDKIRTKYVNVRDNHFGTVKSVETRFADVLTKLGTHTIVEDTPKVPPGGKVQTPESKASDGKASIPETVASAMLNQPAPVEVAAGSKDVPQSVEADKPASVSKSKSVSVAQPQFTEAAKARPVPAMSSRSMKAQTEDDDEKKKRSYSRRDMKAED